MQEYDDKVRISEIKKKEERRKKREKVPTQQTYIPPSQRKVGRFGTPKMVRGSNLIAQSNEIVLSKLLLGTIDVWLKYLYCYS